MEPKILKVTPFQKESHQRNPFWGAPFWVDGSLYWIPLQHLPFSNFHSWATFFYLSGFPSANIFSKGLGLDPNHGKHHLGGWRLYTNKEIWILNDSRDLGKWIPYDNVHISLTMPNISCFASYASIICIQSFAESSVEARFLELGCIEIQHQHSTNCVPLPILIWLMICQSDSHRQSNNQRCNPQGHPVKQFG